MFLKIAILILIIWLVLNRWKQKCFLRKYNLKECKLVSMPIIGHAYQYIGDGRVHMEANKKIGLDSIEQGGVSARYMFNYLFIDISDPVLVEMLLKNCLEKAHLITNLLRFVTGNGSVFAPVSFWRPRRKIVVPIFAPKNLNLFVDTFAKQSSILAKRLRSMAEGKPFPIISYLACYTMDSITETALGYKLNSQSQGENPLLTMLNDGLKLMSARLVSPWYYNDLAYKLSPSYYKLKECKKKGYEFIESIIDNKLSDKLDKKNNKKDLQHNNDKNHTTPSLYDFLTQGNKDGTEVTRQVLCEETMVFAVAGTDTSAMGAGFTMLCLANHQDVQEKVYQELKEVFEDSDRLVTAEDLAKLKYLDCVIKEALRLYPPVPITNRELNRDLQLENGVILPKGSCLNIHIYSIHRHHDYWGPDADEFKPERFFEPLKYPAQYMPFSYGPRNCAGYRYAMLSMKTVLSTLLRQYKILNGPSTVEGNNPQDFQAKGNPIQLKVDIMLKDANDFTVRLVPR